MYLQTFAVYVKLQVGRKLCPTCRKLLAKSDPDEATTDSQEEDMDFIPEDWNAGSLNADVACLPGVSPIKHCFCI